MGGKELERLVGKIRSMHLAVPGAVAHLFHIQRALNQGGVDRAWLSSAFHRELINWKVLALQVASWPTHLEEIVRREPTHLGFCDASGLGAGGVWLDPARTGQNLVWRHPWPPYSVASLVSLTNPQGTIANSNLELAALVLQEVTLLKSVPKARMAVPRSGPDNTPTVSWSTREASMINLVIADILRICALHSIKLFLNPSIFYHPGQENCMSDDASRLFYISDTEFLTHMSTIHPQMRVSWQVSLPPLELLSCVISTLRSKPC